MLSRVTEIKRIVMVRINPGDDILLGLRQAVKEHGATPERDVTVLFITHKPFEIRYV